MEQTWDQSVQVLGEFRAPVLARSAAWQARESGPRRVGRLVGAVAAALVLGVVGCGSTDTGSGVTCDEYAQKELAPPNIGRESQSTDIMDMLRERDLPVSIDMMNKVQSAVNKFCGKPSPKGDSGAKRNNSMPISDAVDWDALSG
ncbi:MAG: hypothetical protein JXO22_12995 [Phycisphaerae bacterium]|nr:hypothetical protein [Phycisphaerae bacterium]